MSLLDGSAVGKPNRRGSFFPILRPNPPNLSVQSPFSQVLRRQQQDNRQTVRLAARIGELSWSRARGVERREKRMRTACRKSICAWVYDDKTKIHRIWAWPDLGRGGGRIVGGEYPHRDRAVNPVSNAQPRSVALRGCSGFATNLGRRSGTHPCSAAPKRYRCRRASRVTPRSRFRERRGPRSGSSPR